MNETYEQEIDLKWLLYRVLRAWRTIVVWAIVIGVVAGAGSLAINLIKITDPEYVAEEKSNFEREHASWEATGANLKAELDNLQTSRDNQVEYNENSVLMKINPLREYNASFQLYVDYDYKVDPTLTYQNIDLSDRIIKAYSTYMTNGELYQYIINNLSEKMELRYFKEIFSVSADNSNNMITISVRHENAEKCQEILDLAAEGIQAKYDSVCETIAEHELLEMNAASYEAVNLSLDSSQKANIQYISDLDIKIQEKNEEYLDWKKEPEPEAEYTVAEIVKSSIKTLIIGGIIGGVVFAVVVAFCALLSGKLLNPSDVKNRFGIRLIGELPTSRVKKPFAFVSRLFAAFGGITMVPEDYERMAKTAGMSLKSELSAREDAKDWKNIVLTGTVSEEELQKLLKAMDVDAAYHVTAVSDILTNAASIEKVVAADCVVLVEKQEVSKAADIAKELEALKAWNKPVIGAVVLNADAVM